MALALPCLPALLMALTLPLLSACGGPAEGALDIAFVDGSAAIGSDEPPTDLRLTSAASHMRAATETGLVTLNAAGEVVPALADRWIVTEDGLSFIFRLRDGQWPDGSDLTAESVRRRLRSAMRRLDGSALGLDLAPVAEVRAMAGRVIEIRLAAPMPYLLHLLAQPELVLVHDGGGTGDMLLEQQGRAAVLVMRPPAARGLPEQADWTEHVRPLLLRPLTIRQALAEFDEGSVDLVLGAGLAEWPLANTGPLSRGTVRLDPVLGLFGLHVRRAEGLLATETGREALALAIDRAALIAPLGIGGWTPTTRMVAPDLPGDPGLVGERWAGASIEQRQAAAALRVARWSAANGGQPPRLTLALARAPGLDRLFDTLARQLAAAGIRLERVSPDDRAADLMVMDRIARFAAPEWFLHQFDCRVQRTGGMCVSAADELVAQAQTALDSDTRNRRLAEAEQVLAAANIYIPFGHPIRWAQVRSTITGFTPNAWAFHPLPPLAQISR
ncbi:ABC transporter substrate-binding protein [Croceibacterium ferulae]|uniref:ABC transporter substrate-binding protein n=1 Tax=Croceibacterium ferulae TaxID=1854641 RepID=UPI000EADA97E|nr:ABC transporter substrate-binding protein [Croceibacterium ferulae]